jgi:1,4-dihydroxy-2-naphthoate octaprenyltransferase
MFSKLLPLSRPLNILLAALTYILGVSVAQYLGKPFTQESFWLGLVGILLAQASMGLLTEVYRPENEPIVENETHLERKSVRDSALYISIASLAANAGITLIFYINAGLPLSSFIFLLLSLIIILGYSIPPLRLLNRGFGEFLLAAHIAYVIPSIGFLLQSSEYHRLLPALAVPLTALAFAYFLVLDFPSFATDQRYERITILRLLSWERAVPFHHGLIVAAYTLFFAATLLGFSLSLIWPVFLTLPFAIFQIIQLRAISLGNRPNWTLLAATALAVFGLSTYILTLTFWLR